VPFLTWHHFDPPALDKEEGRRRIAFARRSIPTVRAGSARRALNPSYRTHPGKVTAAVALARAEVRRLRPDAFVTVYEGPLRRH
jgi:hypothetical protein